MNHEATAIAPGRGPARKAVHDTVAGCRDRAVADLAQSLRMDTVNGRERLELSASSWTTRANLLQRLDDSFEARQAAAIAEWQDGEAPLKARVRPRRAAA
jgi:hypothetical protein